MGNGLSGAATIGASAPRAAAAAPAKSYDEAETLHEKLTALCATHEGTYSRTTRDDASGQTVVLAFDYTTPSPRAGERVVGTGATTRHAFVALLGRLGETEKQALEALAL